MSKELFTSRSFLECSTIAGDDAVLISRFSNHLRAEHQISKNGIESYSRSCPKR